MSLIPTASPLSNALTLYFGEGRALRKELIRSLNIFKHKIEKSEAFKKLSQKPKTEISDFDALDKAGKKADDAFLNKISGSLNHWYSDLASILSKLKKADREPLIRTMVQDVLGGINSSKKFHAFKNIIQSMNGLSTYLMTDLKKDPSVHSVIVSIYAHANQLLRGGLSRADSLTENSLNYLSEKLSSFLEVIKSCEDLNAKTKHLNREEMFAAAAHRPDKSPEDVRLEPLPETFSVPPEDRVEGLADAKDAEGDAGRKIA